MKLAKFILPLALLASAPVQAQYDTRADCKNRNEVINLMADVVLIRPLGAVGTFSGTVLFVALSPLTALADIAPPHDAFERVGTVLMGIPYSYTFERPLGLFCY